MLDHSARSVWSSTRVDSDYWHLVTDLGTESFSLHLLGIVALWLPHPCTIGSPIRFLRAASVNRTEWSRASWDFEIDDYFGKTKRGKAKRFFFRLSSIEISKEIFFLLPVLDILEKRKFFFFPFIFDRNFGKKENFFFRLSSMKISKKGKLFFSMSIFDENFRKKEISFLSIFKKNFGKKQREKKFFFYLMYLLI